MIKHFVPQEFCLKCRGCCRFKEANSVWSPCLLDEEIQDLLDKNISSASISADRRIQPIADPKQEGFVCPFLNTQENKCKIYGFRPLECQLYPFLISMRNGKALLTLDLNCPYVSENLKSSRLKDYTDYLAALLNSAKLKKILKDNPHLIQAYEEVLDIIELKI